MGRRSTRAKNPQAGWPKVSLKTSSMTATVMSHVVGRNDILSPEMLLKFKEGKIASKDQVTSVSDTLPTGSG